MYDAVHVYNLPIFETEVNGGSFLSSYTCIVERLPMPLIEIYPCTRGHDCILVGAGSRVEAARVTEDAKNHYGSGGCSNGDGFSARQSSRECMCGYYEQF